MAKSVKAQARMLALAAGNAGERIKAKCAEAVIVNGRRLSRDQALALRRASELAKGSSADRMRASAIVRDVERAIAGATEAEAIAAGVAETVSLQGGEAGGLINEEAVEPSFVRDERSALVRHEGELIVRVERVKRIRRDDGLANLLASGALTSEQFEIGQMYRVASAKAAPSTRSSLCEREGGSTSGSSDAAVWSALDRAYAALRLRLVRAAIGDDRAFAVLDAVAGRGETIRSLGSGGGTKARNVACLVSALGVADRWLRISDVQLKKAVANQAR